MTKDVRAADGDGWFARRLLARRPSNPERDEAEAQEYWSRRFREHPEELTASSAVAQPAAGYGSRGTTSEAPPVGSTRHGWRVIALWMNLTFAVLQGLATLVLFILGASSDKVILGVAWTALWSFQAGLFFLRYG